ncbi:MAG: matrixin family metalloprotease, partial [Deltaproteobacteria bacterium]|nr:matrixin family metalloprotease [Deltaproteobacteria bacterium]
MRSHLSILATVSTLLYLILPTSAHAYTLYDDGEGHVLYWPTPKMEVVIDTSALVGAPGAADEIRAAFFAWSSAGSPYAPVFREARVIGECEARDGINAVRWIQQSWPFAANMPGMTVIWAEKGTGVILEVDILLNAEHYQWSTSSHTSPAHVDIRNVLTHEVGHFTGLGHSTDPDATMYTFSNKGEQKKRTLEDDDLAGLASLAQQIALEDP